ncbi:hypothetical protein BE04_50185 [Sorangium cellulosum]|uniref:Uncharacterized protein n=2 Tax=Sorangium cellulosum TaxID=56 RepID=A0A150PNK3_SORCE|nr:hypothetical protein SCE1572_39000 [Sorangium cellulosum So0157-2]KYF57285.1 hypothetical protein BE04_50185 [Sorangium cellulosum]
MPVDVSDMEPVPDNGVYPNRSTSGLVRVTLAEQCAAKAEAAVLALSDPQLRALIPCGKVDATCKADFVRAAVGKAFRRPRSRASTCASPIAAAPTSATSSRTAAPASP